MALLQTTLFAVGSPSSHSKLYSTVGSEQGSVRPVGRLQTVCGMVSVWSQFQHNCWIQSRINTTTLGHQRIIHEDTVAVLISARNSRINCHNRAPAAKPAHQTWLSGAADQQHARTVHAGRKHRRRKEKSTPFGITLMSSQVYYTGVPRASAEAAAIRHGLVPHRIGMHVIAVSAYLIICPP